MHVSVTPSRALVDTPVRITVSGLMPGARVVVHASTKTLTGRVLRSQLAVRADGSGVAHVPETLLSAMAPAGADNGYGDGLPWAGQNVAIAAGSATSHLTWLIKDRRVTLRTIRHPFFGTFLQMPSKQPRPGVLLFGGSEGGVSVFGEAQLLASRGFPTLALAYFKAPGLPANLSRIPLEYFERALRWLGAQPGVDPKRLIVDGTSRGSEAALLLGVHDRQVHAVVAMVPSNVVGCGLPGCGGPAWTLHGQMIPYQDSFGPTGYDPIPVERIRGRVFLVCGGADLLWPSCPMARAIAARRHHRATTVLEFPRGGHGVGDPTPNAPQAWPDLEGLDPLANARARVATWPKLLRFLSG